MRSQLRRPFAVLLAGAIAAAGLSLNVLGPVGATGLVRTIVQPDRDPGGRRTTREVASRRS